MRAKIMLTLSVGINAVLLSALTHVYYQVPDWDFVSVDGIFAVNSGHSEQMSKRPPDGVAPRLGEVIELLLPTQQDGESRELFDFETRRHMSEPKFYHCDSRMQIGWIRTNGLDISGFTIQDGSVFCVGYYMAVVPVDRNYWEEATPETIPATSELDGIPNPRRPIFAPIRSHTDTFAFRTAEGTKGILRIVGLTEDRRCVRIHYRLLSFSPMLNLPNS